jgi:acyl carrier protein phosphodiesterase
MAELENFPAEFQNGIARHRRIDAFTDSHGVVKRSVARIAPPFRRYGGILVDVFYDHFLTADWNEYSNLARHDLVSEFYDSFEEVRNEVPDTTFWVFVKMREEDWLGCYVDLAGVEITLRRISSRLRRPFDLGEAVAELERNYGELHNDFRLFFPQLVAYMAEQSTNT